MDKFSYEAVDLKGKRQKGIMEAASQDELIAKLKEINLYCSSFKRLGEVNSTLSRKLKEKELIAFCAQLASLLNAGVTMSGALDIVYQSAANKTLKKATLILLEKINGGSQLSDAMKEMEKCFPAIMIFMTETGETNGRLGEIMERLSEHFEKSSALKAKTQTALIYPVILSMVSILSIAFMMVYVIPQFISMYASEILPVPTKIIIAISDFLKQYGRYLLGGIVLAAIAFFAALQKREIKVAFEGGGLKIPYVGRLLRTVLTSRFASSFSVLFASGVPIVSCLNVSAKVAGNVFLEEKMKGAIENLSMGEPLYKSLEEMQVFDKLFISMVKVGEEASSLDKMAKQTGEYFDKRAQEAMMKFIAVLEPCMIVVLGAIIGFVVIAMIMPIFNSYSAMLG